jgi:hypothetical protein
MIAHSLEVALHAAFVQARQKRHKFISVEHLLLHLLEEATVEPVLEALKVDKKALARKLKSFIGSHTPVFPKSKNVDIQPTLGFQRVVQRAILHVQSDGGKDVEGRNVLVAIYGEENSKAVHFLEQVGATRLAVVNYLSDGKGLEKSEVQDADNWFASTILELSRKDVTRPRDKQTIDSTNRVPKVFISYSHIDSECLMRLLVHLKPLERQKAIVTWSDQRIRAGDRWREDIELNLKDAAVAVLLVSADFLASDFIVDNELPPLLTRAESKGLRILQIILKPCGFNRDVILSKFQAVNDPKKPLLGLDHISQEAIYDQVAEEIAQEIQNRLKAGGPAE